MAEITEYDTYNNPELANVGPGKPKKEPDNIYEAYRKKQAASGKQNVIEGRSMQEYTPTGLMSEGDNYGQVALGQDLNETRAHMQSTTENMFSSLAKAAGLMISTVGSTFTTLPEGIVRASIAGFDDSQTKQQAISHLYDNTSADFWKSFNAVGEELLPVYKPESYETDSLLKNMGTSQFWGETVLKNAGFTAGAIVGGGIIGKGASKAFQLIGKIAGSAKAIENAAIVESLVQEGLSKSEALAKVAGNVSFASSKAQQLATGSIVSFGESSMEAKGTYDKIGEDLTKKYQGEHGGALPEGEALNKIKQYQASGGNANLAFNMAVLTGSNTFQFGKLWQRGFAQEVEKVGEIATKDALNGAVKKTLSKKVAGVVGDYGVNTLAEATEEGLQTASNAGLTDYYSRKYDNNGVATVNAGIMSVLTGMQETFGTKGGLESMLAGAITGFGSHAITSGISKLVSPKTPSDYEQALDVVNTLNTASDRFRPYYDSMIRQNIATQNKQKNAASPNPSRKIHEDENANEFRAFVQPYIETGRFDLLEDMLNQEYAKDEDRFKLDNGETASKKSGKDFVSKLMKDAKKLKKSWNDIGDFMPKAPSQIREELWSIAADIDNRQERLNSLNTKLHSQTGVNFNINKTGKQYLDELAEVEKTQGINDVSGNLIDYSMGQDIVDLHIEKSELNDKYKTLQSLPGQIAAMIANKKKQEEINNLVPTPLTPAVDPVVVPSVVDPSIAPVAPVVPVVDPPVVGVTPPVVGDPLVINADPIVEEDFYNQELEKLKAGIGNNREKAREALTELHANEQDAVKKKVYARLMSEMEAEDVVIKAKADAAEEAKKRANTVVPIVDTEAQLKEKAVIAVYNALLPGIKEMVDLGKKGKAAAIKELKSDLSDPNIDETEKEAYTRLLAAVESDNLVEITTEEPVVDPPIPPVVVEPTDEDLEAEAQNKAAVQTATYSEADQMSHTIDRSTAEHEEAIKAGMFSVLRFQNFLNNPDSSTTGMRLLVITNKHPLYFRVQNKKQAENESKQSVPTNGVMVVFVDDQDNLIIVDTSGTVIDKMPINTYLESKEDVDADKGGILVTTLVTNEYNKKSTKWAVSFQNWGRRNNFGKNVTKADATEGNTKISAEWNKQVEKMKANKDAMLAGTITHLSIDDKSPGFFATRNAKTAFKDFFAGKNVNSNLFKFGIPKIGKITSDTNTATVGDNEGATKPLDVPVGKPYIIYNGVVYPLDARKLNSTEIKNIIAMFELIKTKPEKTDFLKKQIKLLTYIPSARLAEILAGKVSVEDLTDFLKENYRQADTSLINDSSLKEYSTKDVTDKSYNANPNKLTYREYILGGADPAFTIALVPHPTTNPAADAKAGEVGFPNYLNGYIEYSPLSSALDPVVENNNIESFVTSKGSVYKYLPNGKTQRFKTVEGKEYEPQDLTVFVKFTNLNQEQDFLSAISKNRNNTKVYLVDEQGKTYSTNKEAAGKDVRLAIVNTSNNTIIDTVETSLIPIIGYNTFDQRSFISDTGDFMKERHLGNTVGSITYKSKNNLVEDTDKSTKTAPVEEIEEAIVPLTVEAVVAEPVKTNLPKTAAEKTAALKEIDALAAKQLAELTQGFSLDVDNALPRKASLLSSDKKEDIAAITKWWKAAFGDESLEITQGLINDDSFGEYSAAITQLYYLAEEGTGYHEAFHKVTQEYLTAKQIKSLYDDVRKTVDSKLTDIEAEEYLAEDFRNFMLSNGKAIKGRPITNSIFRKIYNMIKSFLTGTTTPQQVYEKLSQGKYNGARKFNVRQFTKLSRPIPGMSEAQSNNIVSSINGHFFNTLFAAGKTPDELLNNAEKYFPPIYKQVFKLIEYNYTITRKKHALELITDEEFVAIQQHYKVMLNMGEDNVPTSLNQDAIAAHKRYLKGLGITLGDSIGLDEKDLSGDDEQSQDSEGNGGRSQADWQEANKEAPINSAANSVKLLIMSLPQVDIDGNTMLNNIGGPLLNDFNKTITLLYSNLNGMSQFHEMYAKLEELSDRFPVFKELVKRLGKPGSDKSRDQYLLENDFRQAFNKYESKGTVTLVNKETGEFYQVDANANKLKDRIKENWISNLRILADKPDSFITKGDDGILRLNESFVKGAKKLAKDKNVKGFLSSIGIEFTGLDQAQIEAMYYDKSDSTFFDNVNAIYAVLSATFKEKEEGIPQLDINDLFGKNAAIESRMSDMLDIEVPLSTETVELSYISAEGKRIYAVSLNNYFSLTVNAINSAKTKEELFDKYPHLNNPYTTNSIWFKNTFDKKGNKIPGQIMYMNTVSGLKIQDDNDSGKSATKLEPTDKIVQEINDLISRGTTSLIRAADKSTENAFGITSYLQDDGTSNHLAVTLANIDKDGFATSKVYEIFMGYFLDELNSIRAFRGEAKSGKNIAIYSQLQKDSEGKVIPNSVPADNFRLFADILSPKTLAEIESYKDNEEKLETALEAKIAAEVVNYLKSYSADVMKYITDRKVGITYSKGLTGISPSLLRDTKRGLNAVIDTFVVNHLIQMQEQSKILIGDSAFYKDKIKRISAGTGTKKLAASGVLTDNWFNNWYRNTRQRLDGKVANGRVNAVIFEDHKAFQSNIEDFIDAVEKSGASPETAKKILEAYAKWDAEKGAWVPSMDEGDAQGWITLDEYREFFMRVGGAYWTDDHEKQYNYEIALEKQDKKQDLDAIDVKALEGGNPEFYFMPIKAQYFGPQVADNLYAPAFHKYSLAPIYYSLVKGRNMETLLDSMREKQVGYALFGSGSKVGTPLNNEGKLPPFYNKEGAEGVTDSTPIQQIYYEFLGIQLDINPKVKEKVIFGSQFRKLLFSNLFGGEVKDWAKPLAAEYNKIIDDLVKYEFNKLIEQLGITVTGPNNTLTFNGDFRKLAETLKENLEDKDTADNVLDAIQTNADGSLVNPIDGMVTRPKIEAMIFSIVNSRVIKQKMAGDGLHQLASTGFEPKGKRVVGESNYLKFYEQTGPNGTTRAMEVEVPMMVTFQPLLDLYKGDLDALNKAIEEGKIDSKLLTMVGYRIPTQGLNSIDYMTIKKFLPTSTATAIILPTGVVAKSGGDYDIDKLNVFRPQMYLDEKTGEVKLHTNTKKKEGMQNRIVQIASAVLSHPDNFIDLITPNTTDTLVGLAGDIREAMGEPRSIQKASTTREYRFDFIMDQFTYFLGGKGALGLAATHNTHHTLSQIADVVLNIVSLPFKSNLRTTTEDLSKFKKVNVKLTEEEKEELLNKSKGSITVDLKEAKRITLQVGETGTFTLDNRNFKILYNSSSILRGSNSRKKEDALHEYLIEEQDESTTQVDLSKQFTQGGQKISDIISQFINAYVDVAKDPFYRDLNAGIEVASIWFYLLRAGVDVKTIAFYMTQPIIKEYVNAKKLNGSITVTSAGMQKSNKPLTDDQQAEAASRVTYYSGKGPFINEQEQYMTYEEVAKELKKATAEANGSVYNDAIAKYGIDKITNKVDFKDESINDTLLSWITEGKKGEKEGKYTRSFRDAQTQMLAMFMTFETEARGLSELMADTNNDTTKLQNNGSLLKRIVVANKVRANTAVIPAGTTEKIKKATIVGSFDITNKLRAILKELTLYGSNSSVRSVVNSLVPAKSKDFEKDYTKVYNDFIGYVTQKFGLTLEGEPLYTKMSLFNDVNGINESAASYTNHSGGAYGGDTFWDIIGRTYGVTNNKHYRDAGNTSLSKQLKDAGVKADVLSEEQMDKARLEVEKLLGKKYPNTLQGNLQVRNYYQVANSDAVFAVARLNGDAEFNAGSVFGGTNTAVQLGIKLNKPVYLWDIDSEKWMIYTPKIKEGIEIGEFKPTATPTLTKNFAGVGSRDIENYNVKNKDTDKWEPRKEYVGLNKENKAKQAIADVFKNTFQNSVGFKPSLAKQLMQFNKEGLLATNPFVTELIAQINGDSKAIDTIKLYSRRLTAFQSNLYTEAFRELITNSNPEIAAFGRNLAYLTILQSGLHNSPITFTELVPHEFYGGIVTAALNRAKEFNYGIDGFVTAFYNNKNAKQGFRLQDYGIAESNTTSNPTQQAADNVLTQPNDSTVAGNEAGTSATVVEDDDDTVTGINISTKSTDILGRALTNPVWGSSKDGKNYIDVESQYKANASIIKAPNLNAADALKYDMNLMHSLIVQKFLQNPELIEDIKARGGLAFLEASEHTIGAKGSRWEGKGLESNFIKVLAEAYKTVTKETVVDTIIKQPEVELATQDVKLFNPNDKEIKRGSVVEYKKNKYILWNVKSDGKAQLINYETGEKFTGTPDSGKLTPEGSYKTVEFNTVEYIVVTKDYIYSTASGNRVYAGDDNSSKVQSERIFALTQVINSSIFAKPGALQAQIIESNALSKKSQEDGSTELSCIIN